MQSDVDPKIEEVQTSVQVQLITNCNSAGEVKQRTIPVHSQIEAVLTLTSFQLIERA